MKPHRCILWIIFLFIPCFTFAQDLQLVIVEGYDGGVSEEYEVLKKRKSVKNGYYRRFYTGGQVNINANYLNNTLNGSFDSKHPNGHPAATGVYVAGMKSGDWTYSDAEGVVTVNGTFKDDFEEGLWLYQYPDGYNFSVTYQKGKPNGLWELKQNDQLLATCNFTNGLPVAASIKPATDSIYRYADSLFRSPEVNPIFSLLKFSGNNRISGPLPDEPRFVSGIQAISDYLTDYVKLPGSIYEAGHNSGVPKKTCYIQITLSQFGTIEKVEILRSFSTDVDRELIKAIKAMPLWIPAISHSLPVRSVIALPYSFQSFIIR